MGILQLDPANRRIFGLDPEGIGISCHMQRLNRHLVAMQILAPETYSALFPPTSEQLAAIDQAAEPFLNIVFPRQKLL